MSVANLKPKYRPDPKVWDKRAWIARWRATGVSERAIRIALGTAFWGTSNK